MRIARFISLGGVSVALIVGLLILPSSGASAGGKGNMRVSFIYKLERSHYTSDTNFRCNNGPIGFFRHEEDTLRDWKALYQVSIPSRGDPGRLHDRLGGTIPTVAPDAWKLTGGTDACAGATTKFSCKGSLRNDGERDGYPELTGESVNGGKQIEIHAEALKQLRVAKVSGQPCDRDETGGYAMRPAAPDLTTKMLTAVAKVSVHRIRGLDAGKSFTVDVNSDDDALPGSHPPHDCTAADVCTQTLRWNGAIKVERVR